jgi:hypothetical protein
MVRFCGLLTLTLNTAGAVGHRQYGTALVDAVGPALLIGWSDRPVAAAPDSRRLLARRAPACAAAARAIAGSTMS